MANQDITLKRNNAGTIDNLYPTTTWTQVENKPSTFTPTSHTLTSHQDVTITSPTNGQVLKYNGTAWVNGTDSTGGGTIDGSGTANEITYWVDSDTLGSLTTATYPSLTELSRVKGVTSGIQTQINGKQDSLGTGTTNQFLRWSGLGLPVWQTITASDVGAAATSHTHGNISSTGTISSTADIASGDRLLFSDAGTIRASDITFGTSATTFLANNGNWETPSGGGGGGATRYALSSTVSTTSTTFSSTGLTFPIDAGKYYLVNFYGTTYSAATTTGIGISVTTSSTTGVPTVDGWFSVSSSSTVGATSAHTHTSFVSMITSASTSLNGILGANNPTSSGTPSFVTFSAIMYGGSSENKTMTIQFRSEVAASAVYLMADSAVTVQELS